MKFLLISGLAVILATFVAADVVVNQLNVGEPQDFQKEGETVAPEIPSVTTPQKSCSNVTVELKDCGSVIVTRLPFLFNFNRLNKLCNCEDGQLKCDRGAGSNFFQRFQIPGLRAVYNLNCKCKCPSLIDSVLGTDTTYTNAI